MKRSSIILVAAISLMSCKTATLPERPVGNIKEIVMDDETLLVDVRIPEEFSTQTASDKAINIPLAELENNLDTIKSHKKVVVFCNKGRQADQAMEILLKNGLTNVYDGSTWQNVRAIIQESDTNKD